jgi:hypothetical protein
MIDDPLGRMSPVVRPPPVGAGDWLISGFSRPTAKKEGRAGGGSTLVVGAFLSRSPVVQIGPVGGWRASSSLRR